jgi:hypothetical protein
MDPCVQRAKEDQAGKYVLCISAKRVEANYEGTFLSRGGSLGACAARGELDLSLSHSKTSTHVLLTERLDQTIEIEIPDELVKDEATLSARTGFVKGLSNNGKGLGPLLFLSDRARLNFTNSRIGASINGSVVTTLAGQASIALKDVFSEPQALGDVLAVNVDSGPKPSVAATGASPVAAMEQIQGDLLKRTKVLVPVNFESIPLKYSNWDAHQSVVSVQEPKVVRVCKDGTRSPVNIAFVNDKAVDTQLAKVEPLLQGIYDSSWETTKRVVFKASPNLTKSVMNVPAGYNASTYAPAAAVNDTPPAYTDETLEAIVKACLSAECTEEEMEGIRTRLATPNPKAALEFASCMASAMSAFSAYSMPYRVDGASAIEPLGLKLVEAESWRAEPVRSALQADDCDGSACSAISVVTRAAVIAADAKLAKTHVYMNALGNSLGAHYVFGTCVLAANAGHADAANEHEQKIAGHAIALAIPKASFLAALNRGADGNLGGADGNLGGVPVVEVDKRAAAATARFDALYPADLLGRMNLAEEDTKAFLNAESLAASVYADAEDGFQSLSMEGTTLASSCMYTHNLATRKLRSESYARDKIVATALAPNVTRTHKTLDAGEKGSHAFYNSMVEISLSMKHALFTSEALRSLGLASPHYRFAPQREDQPIAVAGASPEDLALGHWSAVPLWRSGAAEAAVLDVAHAEAASNVMPMRGKPFALQPNQVESLNASVALLEALQEVLLKRADTHAGTKHPSRHLISAAALVGNPEAIKAFAKTVVANEGILGEVRGLGADEIVKGVATDGDVEVGRFVVVELRVPTDAR